MEFSHFVGIDPGKLSFEAALLGPGSGRESALGGFANGPQGFAGLLGRLAAEGAAAGSALVCLEDGPLGLALAEALYAAGHTVWLVPPLAVHRNLGDLGRGKSDRIDAARVCRFASRFADRAVPFRPPEAAAERMADLARLRGQMVRDRTAASNRLGANRARPRPCPEAEDFLSRDVEALTARIAALEAAMEALLARQPRHAAAERSLRSVPGIGPVTARKLMQMLCGGRPLASHRQLAVIACSAPFPRQSGTSLARRNRTSRTGDRSLKALLYMGALSACRKGQFFHGFYTSQVSAGRHHLSVVNAVVNIMLKLAFTLCKRCELFDPQTFLANKKSWHHT